MKTLYIIPGLGAGAEICAPLSKCAGLEIKIIKWIEPKRNESVNDYVAKLGEQIDIKGSFFIAGVSFGGFIALELAKHLDLPSVILISSIKSKFEMPWYYRGNLAKIACLLVPLLFHLRRLLPKWIIKYAFGINERHVVAIVKNSLINTPPCLLEWSLNTIREWSGSGYSGRIYHIHGSKDVLFPPRLIKSYLNVPDAGHLLIYTHAERLRSELQKFI